MDGILHVLTYGPFAYIAFISKEKVFFLLTNNKSINNYNNGKIIFIISKTIELSFIIC